MFVPTAWDDGLDEAQLSVALHGDDPLVVLAGAGTGKTRALVARLARLLDRGTPPSRVLLLTFTRRAADEMLSRAADLAGLGGHDLPTGGTFHAVAHRMLLARAPAIGLGSGFGLLTPAEAVDLMDLLRGEHRLAGTDVRLPRATTLVDLYSRCINTGRVLTEVLELSYPWCLPHRDEIASLFRAYTERKRAAGRLDFDDLLLHFRALLEREASGREIAGLFDYVLVDEYQDVNALQVDIVRLLTPAGRGLTVVGDEAQAIYGFRGADSRHLRRLVLELPGATMIRLERNFRSRQAILDLANVIRPGDDDAALHLTAERGDGPKPRWVRCHDAGAEAREIVTSLLAAHEAGVRLRDQAVLVRAGHHSDLVELELTARKVPYRKYGGLRFLEAAHVKDFVAAARLTENGRDEIAWFRLLKLHERIGPARARALVELVRARSADSLDQWPELVAAAPPGARSALSTTLERLALGRAALTPESRAAAVLHAIRPLVTARYGDAGARLGDLERLVSSSAATESLAAFLAELALDPPTSTGALAGPPDLDEDWVVVSTIHSAKGLEWPIVHLPHLVDGAMPIDMALGTPEGLEEEQRLFYVAVTRARDELHLYSPLRMPHHRFARDDRHSLAPASRFLDTTVRQVVTEVEVGQPRSWSATALGPPVEIDLDPLWR